MPDFLLPDLGEGLEEAEIVSWLVQVGDHVEVDQAIVEVETAKAAVEVPVPYAGAVASLHAAPGAVVAVGQPLITITADEPAAGFREPGTVVPGPQALTAPDATAGASGNVLVGYGTSAARPDQPWPRPQPESQARAGRRAGSGPGGRPRGGPARPARSRRCWPGPGPRRVPSCAPGAR